LEILVLLEKLALLVFMEEGRQELREKGVRLAQLARLVCLVQLARLAQLVERGQLEVEVIADLLGETGRQELLDGLDQPEQKEKE
jgi:hypothetical protein